MQHRKRRQRFIFWARLKCFIFLLLFAQAGFAQSHFAAWWFHVVEKAEKSGSKKYLSFTHVQGGQLQQALFCYKHKKNQVLHINSGDTLFIETKIVKPDLFRLVKQNLALLWAVRKDMAREENHQAILKELRDPTRAHGQLSIHFQNLHFAHFRKKEEAFIAGLREGKLKEGYKFVNELITLLQQSAAKVPAHK